MPDQPPLRSYFPAAFLSVATPVTYTAIALLHPPQVWWDAGVGFHVGRSMAQGAPVNTHWFPDPQNIAADQAVFAAWFSPGQYALPAALSTLFGFPIGVSIAITCGIALWVFLLGCVKLCERFGLTPTTALLAVVLLGSFRHSTAPFSIYAGGEILLQAALPWVVLLALEVPTSPPLKAAGLAFLVLLVAWFAKLSGVLVGAAALVAACLPIALQRRRITLGMLGGVGGAALAALLLYVFWFQKGETPGTTFIFPSNLQGAIFSFVSPWVSGLAAGDLMAWIFLNPDRRIFADSWPVTLMTMAASAVVAAMLVFARKTEGQKRLFHFALVFYLVVASALALTYLRGGAISVEERHARPAGILFFLAALAIVLNLPWHHWLRLISLAAASCFAVYGLASFASRTLNSSGYVDGYSRTRQINIDSHAVDFLRAVYEREGAGALFVLPSMEILLTLPAKARAHAIHVDFSSEEVLANLHYEGVVEGGLYIVVQRRLAETRRGELLRAAFVSYSPDHWQHRDFGRTRVYFQQSRPGG